MIKRGWLAIACLVLLQKTGYGQEEIVGIWYNDIKSTQIEIRNAGEEYQGRIIWLETTTNSDGSSPRLDEYNPDEDLAKRELLGTTILRNLRWNQESKSWEKGLIYDPNNGKTYECSCRLREEGELYLKGYVLGIPWLGRSSTWTRAKDLEK